MINRRNFLKGVGGVTVGLPFLSTLVRTAEADPTSGPRRVIVLAYPMGTSPRLFAPATTGAGIGTLPYVSAPLQPFADRCLFVSNCDNRVIRLDDGLRAGHEGKQQSVLTGTLPRNAFGGDLSNVIENVRGTGGDNGAANGPSIDTVIGDNLPGTFLRRAVSLGVHGGHNSKSNELTSSFFHESAGSPATLMCNPARALNTLFSGVDVDGAAPDPALVELRSRNQSVLDAVRDNFADLRAGLDARDQRRLDDHAAYIRQLELDVQSLSTCSMPSGIPYADMPSIDIAPFEGMSLMELADYQIRILVHSMACGVAPVGRLEFNHLQKPYFGVATTDDHQQSESERSVGWHAMVHGDAIGSYPDTRPRADDEMTEADVAVGLRDGYRFFCEKLADILTLLDSIPEGPDSTMLDHTMVLMASDFGHGQGHQPHKLSFVAAGNLGTLPTGYHFDCAPGAGFYDQADYNTNHFLTSIAQAACVTDPTGNPVQEFGLSGFATGGLPIG